MAYDNFKPTLWADAILDNLDNALVMGALANRELEGEVQGFGSSVKISEVGNVAVTTYAGSITYEELTDAEKVLAIDQQKYAAVKIDDVDATQAKPKLMAKIQERVAYGIANEMDKYMGTMHAQAGSKIGSTGSPTSIASTAAYGLFANASKLLDEKNAPQEGRVAVIPPWLKEKMVLAGIKLRTDNTDLVANGYIGELLGFKVHVSNNLAKTSTYTAVQFFIEGMTIGFASQIDKVEAIRLQNQFGEAVRALAVYGGKVLYPDTLVTAYVAAGAES